MTSVLDSVLTDLATESEQLDALVSALDEDGWRTPTPAVGWDVAHQIAHLAWTDEVAITAATDPRGWDDVLGSAADDPNGFVDAAATADASMTGVELLARWRAARSDLGAALAAFPPGVKMPWFGPPMGATSMATARFMETWAHELDVADALGLALPVTDRVRHVVHLGVRTRTFAFVVRGLEAPSAEVCVELVAPSGETWTYGAPDAEQSVRGAAYDFALLVTQRRHRCDLDLEAVGADADRWLDIAQAFAGPPGPGRLPDSSAVAPPETSAAAQTNGGTR